MIPLCASATPRRFAIPRSLLPWLGKPKRAGTTRSSCPTACSFPPNPTRKYPYTADGDRAFLEDKPIIEPFALIPFLAAQTSRIRFTTFVLKLAIRPAVLVAKQAASVAVMSENRLRLGVGISPWPEDFDAMDVPWEKRGVRMDEDIDIVRGLCAGGWFEYNGEVVQLDRCKISPVPDQPIPILVGGHAAPALRRAALRGDGWIHAGGDPAELGTMLEKLRALRAEYGREGPFEIHVISMDAFSVDGARRLEDLGVTDAIVGFRWPYVQGPDTQPLQEKLDALRHFADSVIAKV